MYEKKLQFFTIAKKLNDEHKEKLQKKKAHFRGNLGSYSLVSLDANTPELGVSGFKKSVDIKAAFKELDKELKKPGRPTPEKELQAEIIRAAYSNNNILPFGGEIRFLTSELAWPEKNGEKIVNDILGINRNNDLVIIELKSKRLLTELCKQVNVFFKVIQDPNNRGLFRELVRLLSGKEWSGDVVKMIVCPCKKKLSAARWSDKGIIEICYQCESDGNTKFIEVGKCKS